MKKKLHPREQTEELNRAQGEFLIRHPEKSEKLKELLHRNKEKREAWISAFVERFRNPDEMARGLNLLYGDCFFDEELKQLLDEHTTPPAANTEWHFVNFATAHAYKAMMTGEDNLSQMKRDEIERRYLDYLCENSRGIFSELTQGRPVQHLLVGIDLARSKDVIMAEVEKLVKRHQDKRGLDIENVPSKRIEWLPIVDEIIAVWDAANSYERVRDFRAVAKKLNMKYSTVQSRWKLAYRLIYGKEYDPDDFKKDTRTKAFELCANCPPGKYNREQCRVVCDGHMEFKPCEDYKKLYGSDYLREKIFENIDDVMDAVSYDEWNNDEEPIEYTE